MFGIFTSLLIGICLFTNDSHQLEPEKSEFSELIQKQKNHLPSILQELKTFGEKRSHWVWWVFPTVKAGFAEPGEPSSLPVERMDDMFEEAPNEWREVLELITKLVAG